MSNASVSLDRCPNVVAMLLDHANRHGDAPFLWAKRDGAWTPWTWRQVAETTSAFAAGLRAAGVGAGDRVVLVAENRPEWLIADHAIMMAGGITVPAYTTNTITDHAHIIADSGAVAAIVGGERLLERLLPAAAASNLRFLVSMDPATYDGAPPVRGWQDMIAAGATGAGEIAKAAQNIRRDATACIIYTSGTGGTPKGVMLSHAALLHNCDGAIDALHALDLEGAVFLSFLPLSHSYEHTTGQFVPVATGAQIYYAEGVEALARNMVEVRPTVMTAVPRLFESLQQRITRGVDKASPLKRALFERTLALGKKRFEQGGHLPPLEAIQDRLLDRLVRGKVRSQFGGRLQAMVSGGAALNPEVGMFLTALGIQILQGYGQTESAPVVSVNRPGRAKLHTVGPLLKNTKVRIADDGEVLVRGDLVMQGYWRNTEATSETIKDGWLHTGDVGSFDADGHLMITDRKKDIIVLSGGDNVSPARIEGKLIMEPEIGQAMVVGDKRPHLVALLVPDAEWLRDWARHAGKHGDPAALVRDPDLKAALSPAIERVNKKLSTIEKIRRFTAVAEPFSIDNGQMTPTLKVRRHVVARAYADHLSALYG